MRILYNIYQVCFALPVLLVLTILTALVTIVGSLIGGAHFWGYYPGKIWSRLTCYLLLIPVEVKGREKVHKHTSYVFVPNHQGAFDIFLIYGFLGRNFKWMMKKSLRKIPFVGKACESAGHINYASGRIFTDQWRIIGCISGRSTYLHRPHGLLQTRCFPAG